MRSNKRYTNTTFTKRVDHAQGPREPVPARAEPAICTSCGAVYAGRRWRQASAHQRLQQLTTPRFFAKTTCPACLQAEVGLPRGYVYLRGSYLTAHRREIEQLLRNEADRAAEDNPLARILGWEREDREGLVVTTTTEHLAQRLGHALEKAMGGEVRYRFSHENKLARVTWRRD